MRGVGPYISIYIDICTYIYICVHTYICIYIHSVACIQVCRLYIYIYVHKPYAGCGGVGFTVHAYTHIWGSGIGVLKLGLCPQTSCSHKIVGHTS